MESINNNKIDFKLDYRNTNDYKQNMNAILNIVTGDIVPSFDFIDDKFHMMNHENIFRFC